MYNGQDQCVEETQIDWLMGDDEGKSQAHEITQALEYDDWGQVCKTTESTGRVTISRSDPIERSNTAGIEEEGMVTSWYNDGGRAVRTGQYKSDGTLYSERKYRYDGLYRLLEEEDRVGRVTKHTSNAFDRVTATSWSSGRIATTKYNKQSPAALPAAIRINDYTIGEQQFDGLGRVKFRKAGPRTTIQSYEGSSPEPAGISNGAADICAMEYEFAIQYSPKSIKWGGNNIDTFSHDRKTGLPSELKGAHSTLTRKYSSLGSLLAEDIDIHDRETFSTSYHFSIGGRLGEYTDPHEQTQLVVYDDFGRPGSFSKAALR
jgi:hypothetical protein